MSMSGVRSITLGVPDVAAVQKFYEDFGLTVVAPGCPAAAPLTTISVSDPKPKSARSASRREMLQIDSVRHSVNWRCVVMPLKAHPEIHR